MRPSFPTCLPVLAVALFAAASASAQTVSLQRGGEQVDIAVGEAARLPDDFPADVFVPPAAKLLRVDSLGNGRTRLEFGSGESPAALIDACSRAMAAAGWSPARVTESPGALLQAWEKDTRAVVLAAITEDGATRLRMQLLPRMRHPVDPGRN